MAPALPPPNISVRRWADRAGTIVQGTRTIPEETAIALVYDGASEAVMMATPADLEDFAVGFSLTDGIVASADDITGVEIVAHALGIELRMTLAPDRHGAMDRRRRHRAGPVGCGLCGVESLSDAVRALPVVTSSFQMGTAAVISAMRALSAAQNLNRVSRAIHAAGFFDPAKGLVAVREDVGRHNALDKLAGALALGRQPVEHGVILLTSRVSVEMIQKAAMIGAPVVAAVSAPTALAVRTARAAGITVAGIVRDDGLEIFTCPERLLGSAHVQVTGPATRKARHAG
jgi:FdhD protein